MTNNQSKTYAKYSVGKNTYEICMSMFEENRHKLVKRFKQDYPEHQTGTIFLNGGTTTCRYSSDTENVFRQDSFFHWAFGVRDADIYGAIDIATGESTLFIPKFPDAYVIWFGEIRTQEHYLKDYSVDHVFFEDDIAAWFLERKDLGPVFRLKGVNSDSKSTHAVAEHPNLADIKALNYDDVKLWPTFVECRVIKSEQELNVMRYATKESSRAHKEVMTNIKPGWMEYQAEALFQFHCYDGAGMRHCAYTCISASGKNAAILHYGHAGEPNTRHMQDGDMVMFDMGGEYTCYASDISCSYPLNGKFSEDQKIIYTAVYNAWSSVIRESKAGVDWTDMHKLAEREILTVLKDNNLIKGDLDDMMRNRLGAIFMPHGLGHFIGLDVHDVGGYTDKSPKRSVLPGLRSLRTARILEENMAITVEPGCYFVWSVIQAEIDKKSALSEFFVVENLERFRDFGGIRIESDCVIHQDYCEDMCDLPRTIEEIEEFIASSRAKKNAEDEAKEKVDLTDFRGVDFDFSSSSKSKGTGK